MPNIDGQNFLHGVAERLVAEKIITENQSVKAIDIPRLFRESGLDGDMEIRYYGVANIRHQDSSDPAILAKAIEFSDDLRRMRNNLAATGVKSLPVGALRVRERDRCKNCGAIGHKLQEKGVDVGLAVDIVRDVLKEEVDHIVFVSSDTSRRSCFSP